MVNRERLPDDVGITRAAAHARGYTDRMISRLLADGEWVSPRPGLYVPATLATDDPRVRHLMLLRDALESASPEAVVSYSSAALLHGLPTWGQDLSRVHLTVPRTAGGHRRQFLHTHAQRLLSGDRCVVDGVPVTSPARTLVDLGCALPLIPAVVVADAALALGLVTREELSALVAAVGRRPGIANAHRVAGLVTDLSGSVGESVSRMHFHQGGVPDPTLQFEVHDASGLLVGRADFAWRAHRVLGEFDGRAKYSDYLAAGQTAGDALFAEKRREDRLRELGFTVLRWVWDDLASPRALIARVRSALAAAAT